MYMSPLRANTGGGGTQIPSRSDFFSDLNGFFDVSSLSPPSSPSSPPPLSSSGSPPDSASEPKSRHYFESYSIP